MGKQEFDSACERLADALIEEVDTSKSPSPHHEKLLDVQFDELERLLEPRTG